jgi:hypothetical protein
MTTNFKLHRSIALKYMAELQNDNVTKISSDITDVYVTYECYASYDD